MNPIPHELALALVLFAALAGLLFFWAVVHRRNQRLQSWRTDRAKAARQDRKQDPSP